MKYYIINIKELEDKNEEEYLSGVYDALEDMGEYSICWEGFVLATKLSLKQIIKIFDKHTSVTDYISVKEIKDSNKEIINIHIIDWINKIEFIERSRIAEKEYEKRVNAMNDILNSAKKILERGQEGEPKDS